MLSIENDNGFGAMNDDLAIFYLFGEKIAEVRNPHTVVLVGEKVRLGGHLYVVEAVTHDMAAFTSEHHLSRG